MPRTQPSSIPDAPDDVSSEDQRYRLLMSATRAAARRGYDAVSMRGLAKTCKMSLTTVYQLGRSK
ncbi:MAG TPA: TetR family transcriptional regulator, partial [Ilumatobacteraceae bacterium]|nr:TetR family transcriptional regulator [Ilumatobacteraceae bacterium]